MNNNIAGVEKYRPSKLDDIIYHKEIINTLKKLIKNNKFPHTIFFGQPGTGKTSTIISCAKEIYGEKYNSMVLELNGSDDRGIGIVRNKIKDFSEYNQLFCRGVKLVILDEADSMTYDAQFALRRVIENYTPTTRFCLICNYIYKIIPALQSRCIIFRFGNINNEYSKKKLLDIVNKEKIKFTDKGIESIIEISNGDLRKSINLLQSLSLTTNKISEKNVFKYTGNISNELVKEILDILINDNFKEAHNKIKEIIHDNNLCFIDLINQSHKFMFRLNLNNNQLIEYIKNMAIIQYNLLTGGTLEIQIGALVACFFKLRYIK